MLSSSHANTPLENLVQTTFSVKRGRTRQSPPLSSLLCGLYPECPFIMPESIPNETTSSTAGEHNDDSDDEILRPDRPRKAVLNDSSDEDDLMFKKGLLSIAPNEHKSVVKDDEGSGQDSDEETIIRKKPASRLKLLDDEDSMPSPGKNRMGPTEAHLERNGSKDLLTKHTDSDSSTSMKSGSRGRSRKSSASSSGSDSDISSAGEDDDGGISLEAIRSKIVNKHLPTKSAKVMNELPNGDPEKRKKSVPLKEKAPSRKAKEAALNEIHSETQRMIRERKISLPYHKPKQRSLEDFLNRRKLAPTVSLKTSSDELAKVWKHVEERERMAESFYKSESEEELDGGFTFSEKQSNLTCERPSQSASVSETKPSTSASIAEVACSPATDTDQLNRALAIPESEEFPRLQLSEILNQPDSASNTADISDSVPEKNTSESSGTGVDNLSDPMQTTGDEKPSDAPNGAKNANKDTNPDITSNSVLLDDGENSLSLSEKVASEMSNSFSLSEKINSLNLPIAKNPKISGGPDEVIDLDELTTKPGAFGLMQRFMKHAKLKPKKVTQETLISVTCSDFNDHGDVIDIKKETIKVKKDDQKRGEKLVVLKTTLQQKITENRNLQLAKRIEEYKLYEEEYYGEPSDNELEEELLGDNTCYEKNTDEKEGFEEEAADENGDLAEDTVESEEEEKNTEDKDIENPFVDEEAVEGDEEEPEKEQRDDTEETGSVLLGDDGNSDSEGDSDSSQSSEDEALSVPPVPSGLHSLAGTQNSSGAFGESQLAALCSGDFATAPAVHTSPDNFSNATSNHPTSRDDIDGETSRKEIIDSDDEEILAKKKLASRKRKLSFSDEEEEEENDDALGKANALVENDDDVDDDLSVKGDDGEAEKEEGGEDDFDDEPVLALDDDEDDEEVQLAKKLSKGFLEKEAELSESEWGSDDEDERGLDKYEEEEGDKDKISQRRLQKELGKIHMREVLAEDNREVRLLQELLLEDGELHSDGPKRQRLFRWYNQDEDNPNEKRVLDFGENGNENDEEDEETWRRQRLERENFLRKKKVDNLELEIIDSPVVFNDTRKGVKVTPKVTPTAPKSPDVKSNFSIFAKRGSFLGRGEKMLSKLAEITNNVGTKENPVGNSRNNRNMVFSALSPPRNTPLEESKIEIPTKRKGDSFETNVVKKIKFDGSNGRPKVSALEQLKLSEG